MIDPRANNQEPITPPAPLPIVSRRALRRVKDALPIPTTCNCCNGDRVRLVENSEIYGGRSFGEWPYAYLCPDCFAYVGLHPGTDLPLGTLADKPLRSARNRCKQPFERIWREGHMTRNAAYAWLTRQLGIQAHECHFGLFDAERCEQARQLCERFLAGTSRRQA
jgi:hypothetical protein